MSAGDRMPPATLIDDAAIDQLVNDSRRLRARAALELAIDIGKMIVDRFYDGHLDVWRQRGRKCHSFRRLAAHPLPPDDQERLLRDAERHRWSVRELQREAAALRARSPNNRGRPPLPPVVRSLRQVERFVGDLKDAALSNGESLADADAHRVHQVVAQVPRHRDIERRLTEPQANGTV